MLQESRAKLVESRDMMSTITPMDTTQQDVPRAGADLRAARERLGWSLDDVAACLRIRVSHLEALEEGRLSALPGPAYAVAFLRTYARTLGLDAEEVTRRFKAEAGEVTRRPELVFPVPMPERRLPTGAIMFLGLILVMAIYGGWYRLSGEGRLPAEAVTSVPERLAPLAEQALPPVATQRTAVAAAPAAADQAAEPSGPAAPAIAAEPAPAPVATSPMSAAAAPAPTAPAPTASAVVPGPAAASAAPAVETAVAAPAQAPAVPAAVPPAPAASGSRIVLRADADSWMMVKARSGKPLLNRVLKAGETWPVPAQQDLLLTTGNAGGTELLVDGAVAGTLGRPGAVRRDIALDPDAIKGGKLATAILPSSGLSRPRQ